MPRRRALRWLLAAGLLAGSAAACGDDETGRAPDGLPAVEGTAAPDAYRIVYSVTSPDSVGEEERTVQRPFDAHVVERATDGTVTAERWSTLGRLVTRSPGSDPVRIDTAVAPAASDVRLDRFADRLVAAGDLREGEPGQIGGRRCRRLKESGAVVTAPAAGEEGGGSLPVLVERCVDDVGLVLEERWTTAGGQRVLTKRAVELEVGDDVPDIEVPDATALPAEQGNGAVREVERDARPPFAEAWSLPDPEGFSFVGRYSVRPAHLARAGTTTDPDLALWTDVWRRGADIVLLDQGRSGAGGAPFDPRSAQGSLDVPAIGPAELAIDLRLAEVRLTRPDGGFVRLAGTLDPDELVALAATLLRDGGA